MKETFVVIATIMAVLGNIPYLADVIRKKIRPHPYTWAIWSIVSLVTFFGQVVKGAGIGAIPTGASELFTIIIFLYSIRYGFKDIKKTDNIFLAIALVGLIPWVITKDPTISVITVVSIDLVAFIPTLRKTWKLPKTENPLLYMSNTIRHILILLSLEKYNIATTLHSFAMIITNTTMTLFITIPRKKWTSLSQEKN